jgi:acyl-CoA synthetase (AMP-forming)/AMP-acid ligase II
MPDALTSSLKNWKPAVTFTRSLALNARRNPSRAAIVFQGGSISYKTLAQRVWRLMHALDDLAVRPGDVVTLLSDNHPDMLVAYLAIMGLGALPAPINYRLKLSDMEHIAEHTDSRLLFVSEAYLEQVPTLIDKVDRVIVFARSSRAGLPSKAISIEDLISGASDREPDFNRSACGALLHTSGTTGRPKGALRSKWAMEERAIEHGFSPDDRMLCVMPVCLSAGFGYTLLPLFLGATVYLEKEVDPDRIISLIAGEGITSTFMIPSIVQRVLDNPKVSTIGRGSMRLIQSGAGAVPIDLRGEVVDRFGPVLGIFAGATETGPYTNYKGPDVLAKTTGNCIGRPFHGVEVRLLDDDGVEVGEGEVGTIAIRSHLGFDGYWREPELTASTRIGDYLSVGDLGQFDEEGFLYLVGRKRDVIKSGGINVPAAQVEDVVSRHPAVAEVACIGLPDRRFTEIICAAVVLKPGASITLEGLIEACEPYLSRFQLPRKLVILSELPKNLTGRVVKDDLRATVAAMLQEDGAAAT